jgi:hypothetical protein
VTRVKHTNTVEVGETEVRLTWSVSRGSAEVFSGPSESWREAEYPEAELVSAVEIVPPGSFHVPRIFDFDELERSLGIEATSRLYSSVLEEAFEEEEDFNDRRFDELRDRELFDL